MRHAVEAAAGGSVRVNLHCHSACSDGRLQPEALARALARGGVSFAALTDHETVAGLARFRAALQRHGVGSVSGVEVSAVWRGEEVHLLAYGFDPSHAEWLSALRGARPGAEGGAPLAAADVIARAHRVGGRVFLAHPLVLRGEPEALREPLAELQACGLDGVEAFYAPAPARAQEALARLAEELGLLVCAGTDFHADEDGRAHGLGVDMPLKHWQRLRDAMHLEAATTSARASAAYVRARRSGRPFGLHVLLPSLLAVALFVATIWLLLIPAFERALLERKREMIRELTHSAWSILAEAERQAASGRVPRATAQAEARERVSALRYGHENKDYFWLQDMHPRMVMHPYRTDLNGQDLTAFRDPRGARIFVEFADVVRRHGEGYIDYVWQWPDDPRRLEPKESFVKGFEPWGWVIGTGLYLEDVRQEIGRIERGLGQASLLITAVVALLLVHVVRHSRRLDLERAEAVEDLHATTERYRSLVEAATEGLLLVQGGRCRYANPRLLRLLGCSASELELLDATEVLPPEPANAEAWQGLWAFASGGREEPRHASGSLRRRDGARVACDLALSGLSFGGSAGVVVQVHEASRDAPAAAEAAPQGALAAAAAQVPTGIFRARANREGAVMEANPIAARCLRAAGAGESEGLPSLSEVFGDAGAWSGFLERLRADGASEYRVAGRSGATFAVRAALASAAAGEGACIEGLIEDVTLLARREQERDELIGRLQSSLLFLHEPVGRVAGAAPVFSGETPAQRVADRLARLKQGVALVSDASGATVGLVTSRDLCERVLGAGLSSGVPVRSAMSAPVLSVPEDAPVYEALLRMQERQVQHLAVTAGDGRIRGLVSDRELLPFQQYGAVVLTREISRAALVEDVVRGCRRTAGTVKTLFDSGAHPQNIVRLAASVCDAATERFVRLAIEELGPPPVSFAFVALGSQGRSEQSLATDQDNALIYEAPEAAARAPEVAAYFLELGRRVCGWLSESGFPFCRGRFMAQNPVWSCDLAAWKAHFDHWISRAEPEELMNFSVFFDFRVVCGETRLVDDLRRHVFAALREAPAFFPHFARHALSFKPPVVWFGRILLGRSRRDPPGSLDFKAVAMPLVAFARLYALRYDVAATNTLDRLEALAEAGRLAPASRDEITATYAFLTRVRLGHQVSALHEGRPADNVVALKRLGYADRALLRQALAHIRILQRRIALEFLGGAPG